MLWVVVGIMMIELIESEGLLEFDRFCDNLIKIKKEIDKIKLGKFDKVENLIKKGPYKDVEI
jgi:Glycine cleavage system protein P (pyridoxal-binding), C-terminal domain